MYKQSTYGLQVSDSRRKLRVRVAWLVQRLKCQLRRLHFTPVSTLRFLRVLHPHHPHGSPSSWEAAITAASTRTCRQYHFKNVSGFKCCFSEHWLGSNPTVKVNENNRNSPQLTLLIGHGLILYLSSVNIIFDGGRCLAASAKRRRVPNIHGPTVQLPSFGQYFILVGQWGDRELVGAPTGRTHCVNYF